MVANGRKLIKEFFRASADLAVEYPLVALVAVGTAVASVAVASSAATVLYLDHKGISTSSSKSSSMAYDHETFNPADSRNFEPMDLDLRERVVFGRRRQ